MSTIENNEEEEFTDEQFLIWIKAYSEEVEEAGRLYWARKNEENNAMDSQNMHPTD